MTETRTGPRTASERRYRAASHYLRHKTSALEALTQASRDLKDAHAGIASFNPSVELLEKARAGIEVALREARGMANLDDAAPAHREPVA
jgi:hypothetical protein